MQPLLPDTPKDIKQHTVTDDEERLLHSAPRRVSPHRFLPGLSVASTSTRPETDSVSIPSPRKKRLQHSVSYARPSTCGQRTNPGSSMEDTDVVALKYDRMVVRQFIRVHPHAVEPFLDDPAAMAAIRSTLRLGTPLKSLYGDFFLFSNSPKPRFTCDERVHAATRSSRAIRHRRQTTSALWNAIYL